MADHPLIPAASTEGGLVQDTLLDVFLKRMPLAIGPTEVLGDIVQSIGSIPLSVVATATGTVYFYDEDDTTTADDGITCLVDGNGHRYKVQESAAVEISSVLATSDTPPGSPAVGAAYVVDVAPTGAWAAHAKDLAVWTTRGWVFASPHVGATVYDQAAEQNIQYLPSGSWEAFATATGDGSIAPAKLAFPAGIPIEETLDAPPVSPGLDQFWLVGDTPTGDFTGHAGDIAFHDGAAWQFIGAYEGATVFHKDFALSLNYVGGEWLGGAGSNMQEFSTAGAATWTKPATGTMALIECWGAGASGARAASGNAAGGGGGGAHHPRFVPLALLAATESVTVGAGGAAVLVNNTAGNTGGSSSFGSWLTAYGGGSPHHGSGGAGNGGGGGGGGGQGGTGGSGGDPTAGPGGQSGSGQTNQIDGGGAGGTGGGSPGGAGLPSENGGGGGGGGGVTGTGGVGGGSKNGGAGGGGGGDSTGGAGGVSLNGGNGGNGATGTAAASDGAQPGGGGGGSEQGNSGKGGDGLVRVTVW